MTQGSVHLTEKDCEFFHVRWCFHTISTPAYPHLSARCPHTFHPSCSPDFCISKLSPPADTPACHYLISPLVYKTIPPARSLCQFVMLCSCSSATCAWVSAWYLLSVFQPAACLWPACLPACLAPLHLFAYLHCRLMSVNLPVSTKIQQTSFLPPPLPRSLYLSPLSYSLTCRHLCGWIRALMQKPIIIFSIMHHQLILTGFLAEMYFLMHDRTLKKVEYSVKVWCHHLRGDFTVENSLKSTDPTFKTVVF